MLLYFSKVAEAALRYCIQSLPSQNKLSRMFYIILNFIYRHFFLVYIIQQAEKNANCRYEEQEFHFIQLFMSPNKKPGRLLDRVFSFVICLKQSRLNIPQSFIDKIFHTNWTRTIIP